MKINKLITSPLILLTVAISVCFNACSKKADDTPASLDHKVVFKASTNPQTGVFSATYSDGSGKTEVFTPNVVSVWTSKEYVISPSVKTIDFSAMANGQPGVSGFYLNVEIWIDGTQKAEYKTTTVNNTGKMKASVSYSF